MAVKNLAGDETLELIRGSLGNDVDGAARTVPSEERSLRTAQYFHAFNLTQFRSGFRSSGTGDAVHHDGDSGLDTDAIHVGSLSTDVEARELRECARGER